MLTFKRWTKILGYAFSLLLFSVLALIFFDMISKQTSVEKQIVKVENKAQANTVDIWKISYDGKNRYRLKANSMDKKKNGTVVLHKAQLWYFTDKKPTTYIKADRATVYTNNNIYATGHVFLKRKDLQIYAHSVYWNDAKKIARSEEPLKGHTQKSSFSGKGFIYYQIPDKLVVKGVDIWLK